MNKQIFLIQHLFFHDTGNYIYIPLRLYLLLVLKSLLLQVLSAASSEIYTRARLYLTLVLKSTLPNIVSVASFKLLVVLSNYFLLYIFSQW